MRGKIAQRARLTKKAKGEVVVRGKIVQRASLIKKAREEIVMREKIVLKALQKNHRHLIDEAALIQRKVTAKHHMKRRN